MVARLLAWIWNNPSEAILLWAAFVCSGASLLVFGHLLPEPVARVDRAVGWGLIAASSLLGAAMWVAKWEHRDDAHR